MNSSFHRSSSSLLDTNAPSLQSFFLKSAAPAPAPYNYARLLFLFDHKVHGSNLQWRGRSFAASVPSDSSKLQRVKKRLSKHERYSLIKSFVDRYRDLNAGKFPSITVVKKQTGGSYYTVREIIQRIEHEYCKQSVEKKFEAPADKPEKKILSRTDAEKESLVSAKYKVDPGSLEKAMKSDRILETGTTVEVHDHKILDETSQPIVVNYTAASAFGQIECTEEQAAGNSKASSKQDPEVHHAAGRTGMEVAQQLDVTENCGRGETTFKGLDYSSMSERETTKSMAPQEESPPERPTVWGRVKSLADGFINFWKKI